MKNKIITQLLDELKKHDITPEEVEDMLDELGMREQVIKQIIDSEKYIIAKKVWDDIFNNNTLIYDNFNTYYFSICIPKL